MDSYEYAVRYEDIVSCEWVMELMTNSWTPELNNHIEDIFYILEDIYKLGITSVDIALGWMVVMSNSVISGLHKYLKYFPRVGFSKKCGENVADITAYLVSVSEILF